MQKPPTAQNYSFGHIGVDMVSYNTAFQDLTKEGGYIESLDRHVSPRSLYLTQLRPPGHGRPRQRGSTRPTVTAGIKHPLLRAGPATLNRPRQG